MVKTPEVKGIRNKDPIVLRMRKDASYRYIGNYVKPKPEFVSEGYKEFVSSVVSDSGFDKIVIKPRGGPTYVSYQSPVHKPLKPLERFMEEDFQGPFRQCDNPLMEKIIYKNREIFFGLINKKFVAFTTFFYYDIKDKKKKKGMNIYKLEEVSEENNNRGYLRAVAKVTLTDLMNKEIKRIKKIEDDHKRTVSVYRMNWPEYNYHDMTA